MIDPKSLRIGNLVLDSTRNTTTVESIVPEHKRIRFPVELTEERLRYFGFTKCPGNALVNISLPYWAKDALLLFFNDSPPENTYLVGYGFNVGPDYYAATSRWIDTVHDLQNIYREWKGTELTYKVENETGLTPTEPDTKEHTLNFKIPPQQRCNVCNSPVIGSNGIINGDYKEEV